MTSRFDPTLPADPTHRTPTHEQDHIITIAIGRIDANGRNLSDREWDDVTTFVHYSAQQHGTVVASAYGTATTTDQPDTEHEDTFIVLVLPSTQPGRTRRDLRLNLGRILAAYGLTSACFAPARVDPVFVPTTSEQAMR